MSKSVLELLEEVRSSEELQKEVSDVLQKKDNQAMLDFLRHHDCDASLKEAKDTLKEEAERIRDSGELTAEELEAAAGGTVDTVAYFVLFTVGLATIPIGTGVGIGVCWFSEPEQSDSSSSSSDDSGC